jgi:hypothetical protein
VVAHLDLKLGAFTMTIDEVTPRDVCGRQMTIDIGTTHLVYESEGTLVLNLPLAHRDARTQGVLARSSGRDAAGDLGDPSSKQSVRLQAFVDFVTANNIEPVTKYAKDNWPAKPGEFYAEALSLWHNDPKFFESYSKVLKQWFDGGNHLK